MGDALAIALLESRGFTAEDFARSHPAGSLGRRLLLHVRDVMHRGEHLPQVALGTTLRATLEEMSRKGLGMSAVVDTEGRLAGIFTDGDLRRALDRGIDVHRTAIDSVLTRDCVTIEAAALAAEALRLMESRSINGLLVIDETGRPVGALNMHDLLRAGVM
jgi:arabinose-5-phosphate isomerase